MSRATVILTDGNKSYKYYWVIQTSGGIYHGFFSDKKDNAHFSYHIDGNSHFKVGNTKRMMDKQEPLLNIQAVKELTSVCHPPNMNLSEFGRVLYRQEKLDNTIWIDIRCFPKDASFNIAAYLVMPKYLAALLVQMTRKNRNDYHLIQIINSINPLLLVHASSTTASRDFMQKIIKGKV